MSNKKIRIIPKSNKSKEFMQNFCNVNTKNLKDKLINYFCDKKVYCEIFNGNDNLSESFCSKLKDYNAIIYKTLSKNLDYIIFKDGRIKTKRFASLNNIKLVNPFWVDDKITKGIFDNDSKYFVETNYVEFALDNVSKNKNDFFNSDDEDFDFSEIDEFDSKFSNYVDSKMKSYKSEKKLNKKNNNELYYPLFDVKQYRQKRKSDINISNFNVIQNYSSMNNKTQALNKFSIINKNIKPIRNKSQDNINKQTIIEIKNDKLSIGKNINNKDNNHIIVTSDLENIINANYKINIFTYLCDKTEITSLNDFEYFEYIKDIEEIPKNFNKKRDILLINWEKNNYNYKIYKFLFDKILLIDIYQFLIEFVNETFDLSQVEDKKKLLNKVNSILLMNNFILLNYKIINQNNNLNNLSNIHFIINRNIPEEEYNILFIMLKKYLGANVYSNFIEDCKSFSRTLPITNLFKNPEKTEITESFENDNPSKLYLVTKNKSSNLSWLSNNKKYNLMISTKYIYDSFLKGSLIDLNNKIMSIKYEI